MTGEKKVRKCLKHKYNEFDYIFNGKFLLIKSFNKPYTAFRVIISLEVHAVDAWKPPYYLSHYIIKCAILKIGEIQRKNM